MAGRGNPKWVKGKSGNPNGRPKDPFAVQIRERTNNGKLLVDKAFQLLESDDEDIQVKALNWLGDRGWGKPMSTMDLSELDNNGKAVLFAVSLLPKVKWDDGRES
jgi:hypothetical protein